MPAYDVTPRPAVRITQFHAVTPNTPFQNFTATALLVGAWLVGLSLIAAAVYFSLT